MTDALIEHIKMEERVNEYVLSDQFCMNCFNAPEGTSGSIFKSHRPSIRLSVRPLQTDKGNLIKLHRTIKQNEKVCRTQKLDSHDQGQGHNRRSKVCHIQIMCQP